MPAVKFDGFLNLLAVLGSAVGELDLAVRHRRFKKYNLHRRREAVFERVL